MYALTAVHNFINMYNLDDLDSFQEGENEDIDKDIDKENVRLIEKGSDVGINQRRDKIARLI